MSDFITCANIEDLRSGECKVVAVNDKNLALYNVNGKFHVTQNSCLHQGGPLGDGILDGETVTCPWHDWQFNVISGKNSVNENVQLQTFEVKIDGEEIRVKI